MWKNHLKINHSHGTNSNANVNQEHSSSQTLIPARVQFGPTNQDPEENQCSRTRCAGLGL